jgi:hypothetical protein
MSIKTNSIHSTEKVILLMGTNVAEGSLTSYVT